jgi:hypothetical protein
MHLSYTLSSQLKQSLSAIDTSRAAILLTPLTLKQELQLRWETTVTRIHLGLSYTGTPVTKTDVVAVTTSKPRKPTMQEVAIGAYWDGLGGISQDWLASPKPVTSTTLVGLYALSCQSTFGNLVGFRSQEKELARRLGYLEGDGEHPVVTAAIAYLLIRTSDIFGEASHRMALLTSYLFLYKRGYDIRGALTFEAELFANPAALDQAIREATGGSATLILEYMANAISASLEKTVQYVGEKAFAPPPKGGFFRLSERQKSILSGLSVPNSAVTNRQVQKRFGISQITASRDLTKLASLGLLYPHGKGRATYYMRI